MQQIEISQKIVDYAIWYYLRYYPSKNKLAQKLEYKFGPDSEKGKKYGGITPDEVDYILYEKMRNIIQEREVCYAKIKSLIGKNKNISYIKNNLRQKLFEGDLVEEILVADFDYHEKTVLIPEKIEKKIRELQRRGKSIGYIKQKLIERERDAELVHAIIAEYFPHGDKESLRSEYEKLKQKKEKQKVIEKLLRKGFYYGDIKQVLDENI